MIRTGIAVLLVLLVAATAVAAGRPVTLVAEDGTALSALFYEAATRPSPGVVLVHMLGRSHDEWETLAERLREAGVASLAIDLRGHGRSRGNGSDLHAMVSDVRAAVQWLAASPLIRADAIGVVGASLGANLAAIAAAEMPVVRAVGLLSPSLDYRGVRLDAGVMRKLGTRPIWLASSTDDPYALRTLKELATDTSARHQRLSTARAHGTQLLSADQELARALVDWLQQTLIS